MPTHPAWAAVPHVLPAVRHLLPTAAVPQGLPARNAVHEHVRIRSFDGTVLAAEVYQPARPGPHPVVVIPGAWISPPTHALTSVQRLTALAESGYVAVRYDPRGFRRSGGMVDMAGPKDVGDVSRIIDWALAHTDADPSRIGLLSESYGATVSLNAAAFDPRIRAVAALSGWTDTVGANWRNGTRATTIGLFQELLGKANARFDEATTAAFAELRRGGTRSHAWARQRSPRTHLERLNRNRPAILMVNEWDDPLVPAGQTGEFLDALEGPRQLQMRPGGHGDSTNPTTRPLGGAPTMWEQAVTWVDRYVAGTTSGPPGPPVVLQPRTSKNLECHPSWSALQRTNQSVPLTPAHRTHTVDLIAGAPSAAESGPFPVAGLLDTLGVPQPTLLPLLAPPAAAVWTSTPFHTPQAVRGVPRVTGSLTSSDPSGTLIAHLYDTDALGHARLLTHAPFSFRGHPAGRPVNFTLALPATAWDLPVGHRLAVVFDTVDHRYASDNPVGGRLSIDTSATRLTVPLTPRPPD